MTLRQVALIMLMVNLFGVLLQSEAQSPTITEENIQIGYVLPGRCWDISSDSKYVAVMGKGIYELASGTQKFAFLEQRDEFVIFSPDGRYVQMYEHGVYDVNTGEMIHAIESFGVFSDNGRYIAVFVSEDEGGYLFDLDERTRIIDFPVNGARFSLFAFSPDSRYLAVQGAAVYDTTSGKPYFQLEIDSGLRGFSPDGLYLATNRQLIEMATQRVTVENLAIGWDFHPTDAFVIGTRGVFTFSGEHVLQTSGTGYFSPDGRYAAFRDDAVYEVGSWQRLFNIEGDVIEFNVNGSLLLTDLYPNGTRWYEVATGDFHDIQFPTAPVFSRDGSLVVDRFCTSCAALDPISGNLHYEVTGYGIFSENRTYMVSDDHFEVGVYERDYCRIYSSSNPNWVDRTGLVAAQNVNVRENPDTAARVIASGSGNWLLAGRNSGGNWYLVRTDSGIYGWVSSSAVQVVALPPSLPVVEGEQ